MSKWVISCVAIAGLIIAVLLARLTSEGVWLSGQSASQNSTHNQSASITTSPCDFEYYWRINVDCGVLNIPATPTFAGISATRQYNLSDLSDSSGASATYNTEAQSLAYAIFRAADINASNLPVLYLHGGPGGSSRFVSDGSDYWQAWHEWLGRDRDVVFLDPRGTGQSRPRWRCTEFQQWLRQSLQHNLSISQELEQSAAVLMTCFRRLKAQGRHLVDMGSHHSAADAATLMRALGYQQWHTVGVSYGTMLALMIARQDTEKQLQSLVLDSMVTPQQAVQEAWPEVLNSAIVGLVKACAKKLICDSGELFSLADIERVLQYLRKRPLTFSVELQGEQDILSVVLNDQRFVSLLFDSTYSVQSARQVGRIISEFEQYIRKDSISHGAANRFLPILSASLTRWVNYTMDPEFDVPIFFAVTCRDFGDFSPEQRQRYAESSATYSRWHDYTAPYMRSTFCSQLNALFDLPNTALLRDAETITEVDEVTAGSAKNSAEHSSLAIPPVLILAGGLDGVTPARDARHFFEQLQSPGALLDVVDSGHGVASHNDCVIELMGDFFRAVDSGDLQSLIDAPELQGETVKLQEICERLF